MNYITLDKKRPIRITHSVIMKVEDERQKSFLNFEFEKMTFGDLIVLCYYGCKKADEDFKLTIDEVGDHLNNETMVELLTAFANDMGVSDEEKK